MAVVGFMRVGALRVVQGEVVGCYTGLASVGLHKVIHRHVVKD